MPDPRLLLLMTATTYKARAFLAAAERLGVEVVVGTDQPPALASLNPAGNLVLDFTAPERAAAKVVEHAARQPISAVVAADDDGVVLAAAVARALGLPGNPPAAAAAARDKRRARRAWAAAGLPSPPAAVCGLDDDPAAAAGEVGYPCVLKPLDLAASQGVIRADDAAAARAAHRRIAALLRRLEAAGGRRRRPARRLLVERFIPGAEVAVEGLLTGGRLAVLAIFDKPDPLDGPFFEETLFVTPSRLPPDLQEEIRRTTAAAAAALGLAHGPVHAELRINPEGVWPLEVAPRSIGGHCGRSLRFGPDGGVSLEELILRHALGRGVAGLDREGRAAGVMMIPVPAAGVLAGVAGREEAAAVAGVEDVLITVPSGHPVAPPPEGGRYLGFLFARGTTADDVEAALRAACRRLRIEIRPE